MEKFKISATASFNAGSVLGLTKKQAELRSHQLEDLGKGRYRVIDRVQFKVGEEIGYDGNLPKNLADKVEGEKAKAKADAEAKAKAGGDK